MAFTIQEFHDLVRLLEQHPEWSAELRRLVLSQELLSLPELVRHIAELQRRTEERLNELAEAQRRTEEHLNQLAEAQRRTEERVNQLAEAQQRTEERLQTLEDRFEELATALRQLAEAQRATEQRLEQLGVAVSKIRQDLDGLLGIDLERRYRERAAAYFQKFLRRIKVLDHQTLGLLLDEALDAGVITPEEKEQILLVDVVAQGRRDGEEAYLAVEVSVTVDAGDVERAASRAALLQKVTGRPVIPAVAGRQVDALAAEQAAKRSVACFLDGRPILGL
ncbi:MAG: hypothetical protein NZM33_00285 [Bryobacteraceae bacterium]|nr:hypothetical protein [Bryobacteraceae bacterium]